MSDQGLRHLQADVTPTDDHPSFDFPGIQQLTHFQAALKSVYPADCDGVRAGQIRTERQGAGGDQQLIVLFPPDPAAAQITDTNFPRSRIKLLDFMENPNVNPVPLPKCFRSADDERFFLVDNPADIVGDPSGGIGGMGAALEDNNLQLGTTAFGL